MNFIEKIVLDKLKKKERKEKETMQVLREFTKGTVKCYGYDKKTGEYYEVVLTDETDKYI